MHRSTQQVVTHYITCQQSQIRYLGGFPASGSLTLCPVAPHGHAEIRYRAALTKSLVCSESTCLRFRSQTALPNYSLPNSPQFLPPFGVSGRGRLDASDSESAAIGADLLSPSFSDWRIEAHLWPGDPLHLKRSTRAALRCRRLTRNDRGKHKLAPRPRPRFGFGVFFV